METEKIDVPKFDGFECIGIAVPADHMPCSYLNEQDEGGFELIEAGVFSTRHRICYRKIKPKRIVFELIGKHIEPKKGEWIRKHEGDFIHVNENTEEYFKKESCVGIEVYRIVEEQS